MWPVYRSGYIVRVGAHMHLTGRTFKMVLNPGTPQAKTILNVGDYNFHYQRAYNIAPVAVSAGDKVQVTCTLRSDLRPRASEPAPGAASLHHLGRRVLGRDVPRTDVDVVRNAELPRFRSDRSAIEGVAPVRPAEVAISRPPNRRGSRRPRSPPSPELVGGTPNCAGSPVTSTSRTFQSLRTTTEPFVT